MKLNPKICPVCFQSFLPKRETSRARLYFLREQKCCSKKCSFQNPERNKKVSEGIKVAFQNDPEYREKLRYTRSIETRRKLSVANSGPKNWQWRGGGLHDINKAIRKSLDYRLWREAVFKRDDFTCQGCGVRGERLIAEHKKPFAIFPELRFAIDNGLTLCDPCHKKTPTYGLHYKGLLALFSN